MTYSIVARDAITGELGVAVQSHFFSVGSIVPWAESGVGAVATQAMADITYGPLGLELLRAGRTPEDALRGLVAADPDSATRQVAIVDATGRVATHTGDRCIAEAGHRLGDGYSVQANMMWRAGVPDAMASAYDASLKEGLDLADRLLAALDAGEAEGGDIRGRQSAAIVVVPSDRSGQPWVRRIDVRVEDAAEPLAELRRLVALRRAYAGEDVGAQEEVVELVFWRGVGLAAAGDVDAARPMLDRAFARNDGWRELLRRLPASGLFPDDPALLAAALGDD